MRRGNVAMLWGLWWLGKPNERIQPYRKLRGFNMSNKNCRINLSKARTTMDFLLKHCGHSEAEVRQMNFQSLSVTLQTAYTNVFALWYGEDAMSMIDKRSTGVMSYVTFFSNIAGNGKRKTK